MSESINRIGKLIPAHCSYRKIIPDSDTGFQVFRKESLDFPEPSHSVGIIKAVGQIRSILQISLDYYAKSCSNVNYEKTDLPDSA